MPRPKKRHSNSQKSKALKAFEKELVATDRYIRGHELDYESVISASTDLLDDSSKSSFKSQDNLSPQEGLEAINKYIDSNNNQSVEETPFKDSSLPKQEQVAKTSILPSYDTIREFGRKQDRENKANENTWINRVAQGRAIVSM